jgi:hypothetical protein
MSIIGKIGREIGQEVAEGLVKKAAPKVMPAVKKPLEWGFKGRKPTDIEDFNYRQDWDPGNLPILSQKEYYSIIDTNMNKLKRGAKKNKYISDIINDKKNFYTDAENLADVNREFKYLENFDVPRELTGKMLGNNLGINYFNKEKVGFLQDIRDWKRGWLRYHNELTKSQKETFDSLSDEWNGTIDELVDAAKLL